MTEVTDKQPETFTPPREKVPKIRRLTNAREVRRLLARLTEQLWAGEIDSKTANAITYTLSTAAKVINDEKTLALAKRIADLEQRAGIGTQAKARGSYARH